MSTASPGVDLRRHVTSVAVVGAGHVGAAAASTLVLPRSAGHVILCSRHRARAEGEVWGLADAAGRARLIRTALVAVLAAAVVVAGLNLSAPGRLLLPDARGPVTATPAALGLGYQDVSFDDSQGQVLRGWWIPGAHAVTVVMVHPWGANRAGLLDRVGYLHRAGYDLLLFDLTGYGESGGDPHNLDWLQGHDVEAAVAYARSRSHGRIVLFGYSLGAALAVEVGSRDRAVSAVVEDSGFDSAVDVFGANFARRTGLPQPFALAPELVGGLVFRVNPWATQPVAAAARLQKPLLVIVGGADTVVPPDEGLALYRAAPRPKRLLVVAGAGHVEAFDRDMARYERTVLSFLSDMNKGAGR